MHRRPMLVWVIATGWRFTHYKHCSVTARLLWQWLSPAMQSMKKKYEKTVESDAVVNAKLRYVILHSVQSVHDDGQCVVLATQRLAVRWSFSSRSCSVLDLCWRWFVLCHFHCKFATIVIIFYVSQSRKSDWLHTLVCTAVRCSYRTSVSPSVCLSHADLVSNCLRSAYIFKLFSPPRRRLL